MAIHASFLFGISIEQSHTICLIRIFILSSHFYENAQ
jgi:hypothetical protein